MKGFGNNFRENKKTIEKKAKSIQKDKLITNALSLHSNGKIKEASEIYNFLIQNKFYDPRVLNNMGSIYSQMKQFDKAILFFNKSIEKFPNSLEAYYILASILVNKGRGDTAKNILKKAIEINPNHSEPYSNLAGIYVGEGNFKEAEKCYQ